MTGINNPLNWELLQSQTYTAQIFSETLFNPIPAIEVLADSRVLLFGFRNSLAPIKWRYAATVSMKLLGTPIFSPNFDTALLPYSRSCKLNKLNLVKFPNYEINPFLVEINIAKWHKEMLIEIWQYMGEEIDQDTRILQTVNDINSKVTTP